MKLSQRQPQVKPINILLVDDDEGDVILTRKALEKGKIYNALTVATDGVEAMQVLRKDGKFADAEQPDLILLDLNMPRKDGRETIAEIKADPELSQIPIVILTTSNADRDIMQSFGIEANCYITKPVDLMQFSKVVQTLDNLWFCLVSFPDESTE